MEACNKDYYYYYIYQMFSTYTNSYHLVITRMHGTLNKWIVNTYNYNKYDQNPEPSVIQNS